MLLRLHGTSGKCFWRHPVSTNRAIYDQTGVKCALVSPWTGPRTLLSLWPPETASLMNHTFLATLVLSVLVILVATIRQERLTFVSMYSVSDS